MAAIVYRDEKGTDLTPDEVDSNFHNLDDRAAQLRTDVDSKAAAALVGANNGIASLNNAGKVVQTALDSEKLDGKTFEQIAELFIAESAKGVADGVAELDSDGLLPDAQLPDSIQARFNDKANLTLETLENDFWELKNEGKYFKANLAGMSHTPEGASSGFAFIDVMKYGTVSRQFVVLENGNTYTSIFNGAWSDFVKLN